MILIDMLHMPLIDLLIGIILGLYLHKWAVREDLKLAETVKKLVGVKVGEAKAKMAEEAAKVKPAEAKPEDKPAEVKPEEKK